MAYDLTIGGARVRARLCLRAALVSSAVLAGLLVTQAHADDAARPEAMVAFLMGDSVQPVRPAARSRRHRGRTEYAAPLDIRTAPQIVAEAARYIGTRNPMRFAGPGCKAFVNMVARRAGYAVNDSMRAFDTRGMGRRVSHPQPGDYRVSARRGGGHVEIVARVEGGRVVTINGNKGRNRVGWSHRQIAGAAYYRPITASM